MSYRRRRHTKRRFNGKKDIQIDRRISKVLKQRSELKNFDIESSLSSIYEGQSVVGTWFTNIPRGITEETRIGNEVWCEGVRFRISLSITAGFTGRCRVMVILPSTQVDVNYESIAGDFTIPPDAFMPRHTPYTYKVLYDKVFNFNPHTPVAEGIRMINEYMPIKRKVVWQTGQAGSDRGGPIMVITSDTGDAPTNGIFVSYSSRTLFRDI